VTLEVEEDGEGWRVGSHGVYYPREHYDDGPGGDNWAYIQRETMCIVDYRPELHHGRMPDKPIIIAGPFPTMQAAKAAFLVIYGGSNGR